MPFAHFRRLLGKLPNEVSIGRVLFLPRYACTVGLALPRVMSEKPGHVPSRISRIDRFAAVDTAAVDAC